MKDEFELLNDDRASFFSGAPPAAWARGGANSPGSGSACASGTGSSGASRQAAAQRACRHAAAAARMHATGRDRVAHRGSRGLAGGRRRRATAEREGFGERKARVSKRYNWLHGS